MPWKPGTLLSWRKKSESPVAAGDVIAEIGADKSSVELEAEEAGRPADPRSEGAARSPWAS